MVGCCSTKTDSTEIPFHLNPKNRKCTDTPMLIIFLLGLGVWAYIGIFAFTHGDVNKLIYPTNSRGEICGVGPHAGRPNVLYFDLLKCLSLASPVAGCPTPQICVSECPKETYSVQFEMQKLTPESVIKSRVEQYCTRNITDQDLLNDLLETKICPSYWVKSRPVLGRCLPDVFSVLGRGNSSQRDDDLFQLSHGNSTSVRDIAWRLDDKTPKSSTDFDLLEEQVTLNKLRNATNVALGVIGARDFFQKVTEDLTSTWPVIILCLIFSAVLAFLWIFGMRYFTKLIVWSSIAGSIVLLGLGSAFCYMRYMNVIETTKLGSITAQSLWEAEITSWPIYLYNHQGTWIFFGFICSITLVVDILLVIFLRKRIQIAIEILRMTSKAVVQVPSVLTFPILPATLQILVFGIALVIATYLASTGEPQFRTQLNDCPNSFCIGSDRQNYTHNSQCQPDQFNCASCSDANCVFFRYGPSNEVAFYQIFNGIYGIWTLFSLVAFGQLVLAGVFSGWYFVLDKKRNMPNCLLMRAVSQTCRYHLGTAIFGALILTLLTLVRMGLDYLERKLKSLNQDSTPVKALLKCMKCFVWCLERFIRYLNRNAYIMTAIEGSNFCQGAREAFVLLLENVLRVAVLTRITNLIILISKLVIMGTSLGMSYLILSVKAQWMDEIVSQMNYSFVPLLLIGFGSFVVASLFLEVYEMGVDTILLSFLIDSKHNDGSKSRPYFMSKSMLKLLKRANDDLSEPANEALSDAVKSREDEKSPDPDAQTKRKKTKKTKKKTRPNT